VGEGAQNHHFFDIRGSLASLRVTFAKPYRCNPPSF
jgi:hypothetical protein